MASNLPMSPQLEQIQGEIYDNFRALAFLLQQIALQRRKHSLETTFAGIMDHEEARRNES